MLKKLSLILLLYSISFYSFAQTREHPWNVGIHFGKSEFNGDMGDASYNWSKPFYGFAGISIATYATPAFDLMATFNYGELGYFVDLDPINYINGKFHGSFYATHDRWNHLFKI